MTVAPWSGLVELGPGPYEGITGNTAGVTTVVTGGTLFLAGGNNITLSQDGQTISIVGAAGGAGGSFSAGVSNLGNTLGNTGTVSNQIVFAGGNNITLSQSTNAGGATITISGPAAGGAQTGISGIIVSNTTYTSGTVSLVNSNGFSFLSTTGQGIVGSYTVPVVTAGSDTIGMSNLGNTAGTSGVVSGDSVRALFVGGNNVTLSQSVDAGNRSLTITISAANQTVQTQNLHNVTLSGNTAGVMAQISSGTMTLAGGNNITLSQNGNAVTISGPNTVAQTNQTIGLYASSQTTGQSSSSTVDARSVSIVGQGAVSVGLSGGSFLVSAPNTVAQTNQTLGLYFSSQTTAQSSSSTFDARSITYVGQGIISVGASGGSVIISATGGGGGGNFSAGMSTQGNTSGTTGLVGSQVVFVGDNNITLSQSVNGASATLSISALQSSSLSATGAVSISVNANTISIGAPNQTNQTLGLYFSSQTTGQSSSSTVDARSVTFVGMGIASVGASGGSVLISVPSGGGAAGTNTFGMSNLGNTAGTSGVITGTNLQMIIVGNNNITVSQSINGSSATLSLSAANQTVQTQNLHNVTLSGNTAGVMAQISSGTMTLAGGNNITLSQNGNAVTISAANTVAQTNQTVGLYALGNTTAQSSSSTWDARSVSFAGAGIISVGNSAGSGMVISATQSVQTQSRFNLTLGGNSTSAGGGFIQISSGVMTLAGGNNITLSQNGNAVTISAFTQTVQTQNLVDITLSGNSTSAGAGYILVSSGTLTLAGGNNITLSQNGNAITISGAAAGGAQTGISGIQVSDTTYTSGTVTLQNANGMSFGASGANGISASYTVPTVPAQLSVGNSNLGVTSGDTGVVTGRLVLVGTDGVGLSGSTNGGSMTLSIDGNRFFASSFINNTIVLNGGGGSPNSLEVVSNTTMFNGFDVPNYLTFNRFGLYDVVSMSTSTSFATSVTTLSYDQGLTQNFVIYTRGTGASTNRLMSLSSFSATHRYSMNLGAAGGGSQYTVTRGWTYPMSTGSSSTSSSSAYSTSNFQIQTQILSNFLAGAANVGMQYIGFTGSMTPGRYYLAVGARTAQTTQGTAVMSVARIRAGYVYQSAGGGGREMGSTTATSYLYMGDLVGQITATTIQSEINFTNVSSVVSNPFLAFVLESKQ